jgi:hypothetical protein
MMWTRHNPFTWAVTLHYRLTGTRVCPDCPREAHALCAFKRGKNCCCLNDEELHHRHWYGKHHA